MGARSPSGWRTRGRVRDLLAASRRPRSNGSSCGCRGLLPSSAGASRDTTRRSRPTSGARGPDGLRARGRAPGRTSSSSSPPTARACSRGSPGALSLAGLSILTAQVFTTEDGAAVDLFEVEGVFEPEVGEERWREFRPAAQGDRGSGLARAPRGREARSLSGAGKTPVTVTVDNEVSDFFTVVEVGAPDRIGLLYDITRRSASCGSMCTSRRSPTYTGRVIDAFYVRDASAASSRTPIRSPSSRPRCVSG